MKTYRMTGLLSGLALTSALFVTACGDDDDDTDTGGSGGKASSSGGSSASGGKASGSGGSSTSGGKASGSGGSSATAGAGGAEAGAPGETAGAGGAGEDAQAHIRVLHLSPGAPNVDVFVNAGATPVVSDLPFPEGTPYLDVPPASYDFDVSATGTSAAAAVLSIPNLALEAGTYYTAVAYDEVANIQALALVDDYAGLAAGKIRVRAIHAASGVGEVDIWNIPSTGEPSPLWTNVDFGAAGDALDLDAGEYTIGVDVDNDATPDLVFALPDLAAGTFVNAFATADATGDVFLLAELRDGTTLRIDPE